MLIRQADVADKKNLKELWRTVFDEEAVFLEDFFATRFQPDAVFLIEEDGKPVSALHALPVRFRDGRGMDHDAAYIVGAATSQACRKRGYMEMLLRRLQTEISVPILLYPAVRAYYEKNGFASCSFSKTYDLRGQSGSGKSCERSFGGQTSDIHRTAEGNPCRASDCRASDCRDAGVALMDVAKFNLAYEASLNRHGGLLRDETAWKFILDEYLPEIVQIDAPDGAAYALLRDGQAVETAAQTPRAANRLFEKLMERNITGIRAIDGSAFDDLLASKGFSYVVQLEGMAYPTLEGNPYIGEQY